MGFRAPSAWLVAVCAALMLTLLLPTRPVAAIDESAQGAWVRPVDGSVARPFVAPRSRYGAGHRGADLAVAAGTPVRSANAGEVLFAGAVAGSLHVVVGHANGLRTSYSYLAGVAVRRGQPVARGQVLGAAGGTAADHAGVLHFGLRIGARYVDPMALFTPADLTKLIRLTPVDEPRQAGFDPPAVERRSLASSLHLPRGVPGVEADDDGGGALEAIGDALATTGRVAQVLTAPLSSLSPRDVLAETVRFAEIVSAPIRSSFERLGSVTAWFWRHHLLAPVVGDAGSIATRLVAWARSRLDCDDDPSPDRGTGGSGHLAIAVAGIDSSTNPETGRTMRLDTARLGYLEGEVRYFSYAPTGGAYGKPYTWTDLRASATRLGEQLEEQQRLHPGREVDLIGHSQGGVVIAEFLAKRYDAGDPRYPPLGTVVTLSSPLRGAPAATSIAKVRSTESGRVALNELDRRANGAVPPTGGRSTAQLDERSRTMRALAAADLPEQIDLTTIGAADDVIVPADHATGFGARAVTVNPSGLSDHSSIVEDPAALDAARLALEGRSVAPCVGAVDGVRGAVEPVVISRAEHVAGDVGRRAAEVVDALAEHGGSR